MTVTQTREQVGAATTLSLVDTARVLGAVIVPLLAQGPVIRRPTATALAARYGWDARAVRVLDALHHRYGDGPLRLRVPWRDFALVVSDGDLRRMLDETPEPFSAATVEKTAALNHFQPHGVLASTGEIRAVRREFNESVLDTGRQLHRLADPITAIVHDEVDRLNATHHLDWPTMSPLFNRIVRRIVLGDPARDDTRLSEILNRLRNRANWAYLRPVDERLRAALMARLAAHLADPAPHSLASIVASTTAGPDVDPVGQIPHWLFAFDALGATSYRALAVLAVDQRARHRADEELNDGANHRPYLSAVFLDTLRLWPTTLVVLRQTTRPTTWREQVLPADTTLIALSAYFHRCLARGPDAHRLVPQPWLDGTVDPGLIPFSAGPARCPAGDLVTFTGATVLAALLSRYDLTLRRPRLDPWQLPVGLDHFRIQVDVQPRESHD